MIRTGEPGAVQPYGSSRAATSSSTSVVRGLGCLVSIARLTSTPRPRASAVSSSSSASPISVRCSSVGRRTFREPKSSVCSSARVRSYARPVLVEVRSTDRSCRQISCPSALKCTSVSSPSDDPVRSAQAIACR